MKKNFLSTSLLSIISSTLYAGPFERLMIRDGEKLVAMARRNMSTLRITPGFKPEKQPEIPKELVKKVKLPRRVKFLNEDHSLYVALGDKKQGTLLEPPKITRENDHSVRVDLEK